MALGSEIDDIVDVVLCKEAVGEGPVSDVPLDEDAAVAVDVVLDGTEVAGIGERVKDDDSDVFFLVFFV